MREKDGQDGGKDREGEQGKAHLWWYFSKISCNIITDANCNKHINYMPLGSNEKLGPCWNLSSGHPF